MPNWCHDRVTFHMNGDEKENKKFRAFIDLVHDGDYDYPETVFSFDHIVPMPKELQSVQTGGGTTICTQEEYDNWKPSGREWADSTRPITQEMADNYKERFGAENWYDWAYTNWATKWEEEDIRIMEDDEYIIELQFDTAWGPPEGIYNAICEKIKEEGWDINVSWFYDEPGMEFAGYLSGGLH